MAPKLAEVLGINRRNVDYVFPLNPRERFLLADDKVECKERLLEARLPVPATFAVVHRRSEIPSTLDALVERPAFVVKPARGFGGQGVMLLVRAGSEWHTPGGRRVSRDELTFHFAGILSGMFSLDHLQDRVLVEEKLEESPLLARIHGDRGVSDVRVIVVDSRPVMAMLRLPSRRSGGSANLHAGGVGVGVEISTGETTSGIYAGRSVERHPDSGESLGGVALPGWQSILALCRPLNELFGLGYLGVDIVLDANRGPVILEVNVRPGLAIQLANRAGLRGALRDGDPIS